MTAIQNQSRPIRLAVDFKTTVLFRPASHEFPKWMNFSEKKKERRQDGLFDEEDLNRQWHELFGEWKILNKYVVQFHTELKKHLRLFHDHDYFNVMHALR